MQDPAADLSLGSFTTNGPWVVVHEDLAWR